MTNEGWTITDHVCRICYGRILVRHGQARCADCGAHADGGHRALCWCGAKLRNGRDAQLRCQRNPELTPETPAEIVVRYVEKTERKPAETARRPVRVEGGGLFDD